MGRLIPQGPHGVSYGTIEPTGSSLVTCDYCRRGRHFESRGCVSCGAPLPLPTVPTPTPLVRCE